MKVGDLVRYKHYHTNLKHVRGVVCEVKRPPYQGCTPLRVRVVWNHPMVNDPEVLDWIDDLEVVSE